MALSNENFSIGKIQEDFYLNLGQYLWTQSWAADKFAFSLLLFAFVVIAITIVHYKVCCVSGTID